MTIHRFFLTAPRGLVGLLADEVRELGAGAARETPGGVSVRGPLEFGYRLCLWSRCASRVLLPISESSAQEAKDIYEQVVALPWEDHLGPTSTFVVDFGGTGGGIDNSHFGAQLVKDAIVDRFKSRDGQRPQVDRVSPHVRINVHRKGRNSVVSIDLSGDSLHRRGWRSAAGDAPLKENLAAALLRRSGWPAIARDGGGFFDPCCGAGTLPIEAALMAYDIAPGLFRERFGFSRWRGHDDTVWQSLLQEAHQRSRAGRDAELPPIRGMDADPAIVQIAQRNADNARIGDKVRFEVGELTHLPPAEVSRGLVSTNPPHGERLGEKAQARELHATLGRVLTERYKGWNATVMTTDDGLPYALGWSIAFRESVSNGKIECAWVGTTLGQPDEANAADRGAFANRVRKNLKKLRKWARKHDVRCYRVYDADIPQYNVAVDLYDQFVQVYEYNPPAQVEAVAARSRLDEIMAALPSVLEVAPHHVHLKVRRRQSGSAQYGRQGQTGQFVEVVEGGLKFWVNLTDYLDTGLFLDHRQTRDLLRTMAAGNDFLNLFCYTGSATVYAAAGGARSTTSVDLSRTYLSWAERNLRLNELSLSSNHLERADVMTWIERDKGSYGLIFVDPPTFSNSKSTQGVFDVQRDHGRLLELAAKRLAPGGTLVFSTNARRFTLQATLEDRFIVDEITNKTIPVDFARGRPIHRVFLMRIRSR